MATQKDQFLHPIMPPRLISLYSDFHLLFEASYYKVYSAKTVSTKERHAIRALDINSEIYKQDPTGTTTLFLQEILRFCINVDNKDFVIINRFEMSKELIAFVTKPYDTIDAYDNKQEPLDIEKMLTDLSADIDFLSYKMGFTPLPFQKKNIYYLHDIDQFLFGDWGEAPRKKSSSTLASLSNLDVPNSASSSVSNPALYRLGLMGLEMSGITFQEWEFLPKIKDPDLYKGELGALLTKLEWLKQPESVQKLIQRLLERQENRQPVTVGTIILDSASNPITIAWSSWETNMITVQEIKRSKPKYFVKGVQLTTEKGMRTFVEHLDGSNCLISLHHVYEKAANFEVFDVSKDMEKVFQFTEVKGPVGTGDLCWNQKRSIAGLISVKDAVGYHVFNYSEMKVMRKSKWQPLHKNIVEGLSFDPEGANIATIDKSGLLLVSAVDTDKVGFHYQLTQNQDSGWYNRCRFNPIVDIPLIAVKYDRKMLMFLDGVKSTWTTQTPLQIDNEYCRWIDWRCDGNLLVSCGFDSNIKVYDKRENRMAKIIKLTHAGEPWWVNTAKWNAKGDSIVITCANGSVKVIDFSTGNITYSAKTADGCKFH